MKDPYDARQELRAWFTQMLDELDEDHAKDAAGINKLRGMIAEAFAQWRLDTGYGLYGLPPERRPEDE